MRMSDANEEAKLSQFQRELIQLAAVLVGEHELVGFPDKIGENMTVRQGKQYADDAVKRFIDAALTARRMGVDDHQIVKMRPALTTRPTPSTSPWCWLHLPFSRNRDREKVGLHKSCNFQVSITIGLHKWNESLLFVIYMLAKVSVWVTEKKSTLTGTSSLRHWLWKHFNPTN